MDPVNVCNIALGQLGEKRLTQLDEQDPLSRTEELCTTHYPLAVAAALEAREWTFATGWQKLAKDAASGAHPVLDVTRFLLPTTVLRVVGVDDGSGECALEYQRRGQYLYANVEELYVRSIDLLEDPNLWSPTFAFAVAFKLAELLAVPVTENAGLEERMELRYQKYLRDAASLDGMQGTAERRRNSGPRPSDMR